MRHAGILDQLNVDVGEYLNPGQNVMKIVNIDQVFFRTASAGKRYSLFSTRAAGRFGNGRDRGERLRESKRRRKQCWFVGTIDFMSLTADAATRTYLVKVLVDNANGILRPGMIVRAHLVRRKIEAAIAVPFFTIIDREKVKAVFVSRKRYGGCAPD